MNDYICYKKRKGDFKDFEINNIEEFTHTSKKIDLKIPIKVTDEVSFLKWFNFLKTSIPLTKYKDLLNLNYVNEKDNSYCKKLLRFNISCFKYQTSNNELNQILSNSIDDIILQESGFSMKELAYCNFEKVKIFFQSKINVFYLMSLENNLNFNNTNKLQFLNDLDHLTNVYQLVLNETPSKDLKINWIVNSINKDQIFKNNEILIDIQDNWESICKDPLNLRKVLLKY
ncbi:hypothetical protein CLIB1444_06S01222 [[Candida] jaroonii]|uniref:Uncharacterized protein n=1 Tax=[Candida] jaroonii TaxID=467808 RepID=A0ACA9Y922_9ASCO|nr:hypothetical protein CLIB1444_06S01222 [[Candida] jaroonii]